MTGGIHLVLPSFASGGAERVMINLAVALHARGERVRVVVIDGRGPLRSEVPHDIEVIDLRRVRARSAALQLVRVLRRARPDAILSSQTHLNILLGMLRVLLPRETRLVLREPTMPGSEAVLPIETLLLARGLRRADEVIASSTSMRARLQDAVGPRPTVHLVPNPVDVDGLRSAAAAAGPSSLSDASTAGPVRLLAVGRLVALKGHGDLLAALAQPEAMDALLDIAGDGPLLGELEATVRVLGLEGRVRFHGRVDDRASLARLIADADSLVQPSEAEGMPNAVLEALALGTPVLATTDLAMLQELAEHLVPGAMRLVPRDSLAAAIGETPLRVGPVPRPSLLPDRFRVQAVADAVLRLLRPTASA
jgi:glycosyltransferase involved in cell wall biosynthesis